MQLYFRGLTKSSRTCVKLRCSIFRLCVPLCDKASNISKQYIDNNKFLKLSSLRTCPSFDFCMCIQFYFRNFSPGSISIFLINNKNQHNNFTKKKKSLVIVSSKIKDKNFCYKLDFSSKYCSFSFYP